MPTSSSASQAHAGGDSPWTWAATRRRAPPRPDGPPGVQAAAGSTKGDIVTVNVSSHGCLFDYLPTTVAKVLLVQENHLLPERIAQAQSRARDLGWHGHWAAAQPSDKSEKGTVAGVAILARTDMISLPPLEAPEPVPGRLLFAHIH